MRAPATLISLMLLAGTASAQADAERAAYTKVSTARDNARRLGSAGAVNAFTTHAKRFIAAHPESARRDTVLLWLGDLLKDSEPREALGFYRKSERPEARAREARLAFRFEPPPRLQAAGWVGGEADPTRSDGRVTLLFFVSVTHPQTRVLLGRIRQLNARLGPSGLRVIGVAAVVDDHKRQTPAFIRQWLTARNIPYPFAIDRQRNNSHSVSLRAYRGNRVPWGVFIDRYGRIVRLDSLDIDRNSLQRCEAKLQALLVDPSYAQLEASARTGNTAAVKRLAGIRTIDSASALFRVRAGNPPERARKLIDKSLKTLLPRGFGPQDAERWAEQRDRYRYSFEQDRLVRIPMSDRPPTAKER